MNSTLVKPIESQANAPAAGWKDFYQTLAENGNVPNASKTTYSSDGVNAIFRGNYLELSEIQTELEAKGTTYDIVTIYTDILNVSKALTWKLSGTALVIYARSIQIETGGSLDVTLDFSTSDQDANFAVFGSEINATISAHASFSDASKNQTFTIQSSNISPGVRVHCSDGTAELSALSLEDGFPMTITQEEENYLSNSFILGALCSDEYPEVAVSILQWVNAWAGASSSTNADDLSQTFYQSGTLASLINAQVIAKRSGRTYVPCLSTSVYKKLITDMAAALSGYEQTYIELFTATTLDQAFISNAQTMQGIYTNEKANYENLLSQAQSDYSEATSAESIAEVNFQSQQIKADELKTMLKDAGIPNGIKQQKIDAAFKITKALAEFGVGIAGMVFGQEETAPEAVKGGLEAVKAVEETSDLAKAMEALKVTIEMLNKGYTAANDIYEASKSISDPSNPIDPSSSGVSKLANGDANNSIAAWDVFIEQAKEALKPLIKDYFEYADKYQASLKDLATYGKALASCQLAVIKASQDVVALQVRVAYAEKNIEAIKKMVGKLTVDGDNLLRMQQLFYHQYLNTKLTLFTVLKAYEATYYYWALQKSSINATLTDLKSISKGLNYVVDLDLDTYESLLSFGTNRPQEMDLLPITITDTEVIGELQANKKTKWILDLNQPEFAGYNRVRIDKVRIWIDGEGVYTSDGTISVGMKTSGNYEDRKKSDTYHFNSIPIDETFSYRVSQDKGPHTSYDFSGGWYGTVIIDGSAAPGTKNDFFEPTPFSEWSIDLSNSNNHMDFSKITKIRMEVSGSAIIDESK